MEKKKNQFYKDKKKVIFNRKYQKKQQSNKLLEFYLNEFSGKNKKLSQNNYLYKNKKLMKGFFFKKPKIMDITYPFHLNFKLIKEII